MPDVRLPASVEAACYFVTAEALTNVAKHASAGEAHVDVRLDDEFVVLTITDDGRGGARVAPGHGLGGLHDRVAAFGGSLEVVEPAGRGHDRPRDDPATRRVGPSAPPGPGGAPSAPGRGRAC